MAHTCSLRIGAAALFMSASVTHGQMTWFVDDDAPPGGDGLAWSSAFSDLQPAMELALPGDQIWLAEGVYIPSVIDPIAGEDQPYFLMPDGVALLGGFRGDETAADQRDPDMFESIISGDLLGDDLDIPVTGGIESSAEMFMLYESLLDNTGTLLFVDRTGPGTRLDGLVFQDAFTDRGDPGYSPRDRNGVFVLGAFLDINACVFRHNRGGPNAAIYTVACKAEGLDVDFADQHPCGLATLGQPSAITITDTSFIDNIDNFGLGAAGTVGTSVLLSDSLFLIEDSSVVFSRTANLFPGFSRRVRIGQPGFWITGDSEGVIFNSRFERCSPSISSDGNAPTNGVSAVGIGLSSFSRDEFAQVDIFGCDFVNNQAAPFGLVRYQQAAGRVENCRFLGNRSYEESFVGGAAAVIVSALGSRTPQLPFLSVTQNLFVGNQRFDMLGDPPDQFLPIVNSWAWTTRVYNNTFVDNSTSGGAGDFDVTVFLQASRGEDTLESGTLDTTAMTLDPLFVRQPFDGGDGWGDDPLTPDVDESLNDDFGDLRLNAGSPAIDAGVFVDVLGPLGDFDGNDRSVDDPGIPNGLAGTIDLGAYEFQGVTCLPDVNQDGVVSPADFNAWILAFNDRSPLADQNRDGEITPADYNAWILNFNNGCP